MGKKVSKLSQETILENERRVKMEVQNAIISKVSITSDDHGCLSAWVNLEFAWGGQGFGGYALYLPKGYKFHKMMSPAGHFIWRVMEIAGVTEWSKLPGRCIRVRRDNDIIKEIGHIIKDDWFSPAIDFRQKVSK